MRKILPFVFIVSLVLTFTSCADSLNNNNPDASSSLAYEAGVDYEGSDGSSSSSSSYSAWGTLSSSNTSDTYYFYSSSGENTYSFSLRNAGDAVACYSIWGYRDSSDEKIERAVTNVSITPDGRRKIYVKVEPKYNSVSYAGTYYLTIKKGSQVITLYETN